MALGVAVVALAAAMTGPGDRPPLMPWPASIEQTGGELAIGPGFRVSAEGGGRLVARAAQRFEDTLLADPAREAGRDEVHARLAAWQELDGRLRPLLEGSGMLRELVPLAAEVSRLAGVGLEALDLVGEGTTAPESWATESLSFLKEPDERPHALEVAFRPAIVRLVDAASGATSSPRGQR